MSENKAAYTLIANLADLSPEIPADAILSRTFFKSGRGDDRLSAVLFSFAPGQELSEHTASSPAILHFLSGRARLTLGGDESVVEAGAWAHMAAGLPHSVYAETPLTMLLLLLPAAAPES